MSFRLDSPTCKDSAIAMVRSQGQRVGRFWACRDRFLENADVYTLGGRALEDVLAYIENDLGAIPVTFSEFRSLYCGAQSEPPS